MPPAPVTFALAVLAGLALWRTGAGAEAAWWLTNATPPVMVAPAPAGPQRGIVAVPVAVEPPGRARLIAATLGGVRLPLAESGAVVVDTTGLADGRHTLRLDAEDRSRRRNRATFEIDIVSDNTAPALTLDGVPARLRAGAPVALRIAVSEPAEVEAAWAGAPLPLVAAHAGAAAAHMTAGPAGAPSLARRVTPPETLLAFAAVPASTPAGEVAVRVVAKDAAGNVSETRHTLAIEPAPLPRQALTVPTSLAHLAAGSVAGAEAAMLQALTEAVRPVRLWTGEFRTPLPAHYVRTTGFGDRRDYADGYVAHHAGYDIAAPEGTPVLAAAAGAVVFAGPLAQRGMTVVLDHGWGVFTLYAHLSRSDVVVGEQAAAGQVAGRVGNTGLSTGPHLHWEVRLRGQPVDPAAWLELTRTLG